MFINMACAGGELTMPQHTCGMPQDEPHKVLSIAAVVVVAWSVPCCLVCVLSLKYLQLQNLWLPHGQPKQHANQISPNSTVRKFIYSSLFLSLSSQKSHLIWTWHSAPYAPSPGPVPARKLHASWICGTTSCKCNGRN